MECHITIAAPSETSSDSSTSSQNQLDTRRNLAIRNLPKTADGRVKPGPGRPPSPTPTHGGARPGAGSKSVATLTRQFTQRGRIEAIVTQDEWDNVIRAVLAIAKDPANPACIAAFRALSPWVMGKSPDNVAHLNQNGVNIYLPERHPEVIPDNRIIEHRPGE